MPDTDKCTWNYRIIREPYIPKGDTSGVPQYYYNVTEAHYTNGELGSCLKDPLNLSYYDDVSDIRFALTKMLECLEKPFIEVDEHGKLREVK